MGYTGVNFMPTGSQQKQVRITPPRTRIVPSFSGSNELAGELPLVVAVLASLADVPEEPLCDIRHRRFVEIDADNFDSVMQDMKPRLTFAVENKISDDNDPPQLKIELNFRSLDDLRTLPFIFSRTVDSLIHHPPPQDCVRLRDPIRCLRISDFPGRFGEKDS